MKIKTKRPVLQANRIFTDREEPRASFWKNYTKFKESMQEDGDIRVLTYYGIGGIGKTSLLKKLQEELQEEVPNSKHVHFDFDIAQESRAVLEHLRVKLENQYHFQFPLFSLGVYMYARKIGDDVNAVAIKGMIDKNPILNGVMSAVGCLPLVGVTAKLVMAADKGVATIKKMMTSHRQEIKDIEDKDADELYQYLPILFSQDLSDNIEGLEEPFVVFLDTYERLVNEMVVTGESLNNDLWLRGENGLIQNTANVLWVISGREKLKWEKFDADWAESLEQHMLGTLSETDADSFLSIAGIGDKKLRGEIYKLTNGTPVYLDLCVDRYVSLVAKGQDITIGNFGKDVYVLVERFARYMDDNKKDIVYFLACLRMWDDRMIKDLAPKILPNFSMTAYEKVKDFSFVVQSDEARYNVQQTVADILLANCPTVIKDAVLKKAPEYVNEWLDKEDLFDKKYGEAVHWLIMFGLRHHKEDGELQQYFVDYVDNRILKLTEAAQYGIAENLIAGFEERFSIEKDGILNGFLLRMRYILSGGRGNYQEAHDYAKQVIKVYEKNLGLDSYLTLTAMQDLAVSLSDLGNYAEAMAMQKQVLAKCTEILGENHSDTINAMNNLAASLSDLGNYAEALEIWKQVLAKREEILGETHPYTIDAMDNLANSLSDLGNYAEAMAMEKQVLAKRKEYNGPFVKTKIENFLSVLI